MEPMLIYLEPWIVQDGQVPELQPSDILRRVGVAAACWSSDRSIGVDGWEAVPGKDPDGFSTAHVILDGSVVWRYKSALAVLQVHDTRFVLKGRVEQVGVEDFERLALPPMDERARVHASLYVMPGGEYELSGYPGMTPPDVARDWRVNGIFIEGRATEGSDCGDVTHVEPLERMRCCDDEALGGEYLLDLVPHSAGQS
jgi:hypothetical protein